MDTTEFYKQPTLPNLKEALALDPPLPEKIGPYKIEALLTKGGMSLLYLGLHPDQHTPLVIKILSPQFVKNQEMTEQFLKEAKIIALSNHPNIVKLYGQGEWEQGLYIAMEFIQGISLKQFILQHSLSVKRSLEILLQVAYALLHLHTHGIIHRDLKPENILITEDGSIKVIDFGIAQLAQESKPSIKLSQMGFVGTPSYMSPEQKKDPLHVSYATDIYALGVIAYELLIGKLSFGKIQLSYLPPSLQPIIQKAIAPAVQDRYEDIVEWITAISAYLKTLNSLPASQQENGNLFSTLESLQKSLVLPNLSSLPYLNIGHAKSKGPLSLDLYYDFFKLADTNLLFILAQPLTQDIDAVTQLAFLKGLIHGLLSEPMQLENKKLNILSFVSNLNTLVHEDGAKMRFAFSVLHLDTHHQQFTYLSCGFDALWHISSESEEPHILRTENPLLGASLHFEPYETLDNWATGDLLLLHSFNSSMEQSISLPTFDASILAFLEKQTTLSAQTQADNLLKHLISLAPDASDQRSHITLCLEKLF
ncbi:MAG: protein kinase [Chlamydiota bacterium]